jgi:hypothetical protein
MTFAFRLAVREGVSLLIGLAGGTGSGKTYSAMMLAKGLAGGRRFAVIDTEAGRARHYADLFEFDHGDLHPPFRPDAYAEAIAAADTAGYPVIVVDSMSHEHAGDGGLLDMHDAELDRMAGDDWQKRERVKMAAWINPKGEHKRFVSRLLQLRAHLILCLRAEQKIALVMNAQGKTEIVPKRSLTGLDGWIPIAEKSLPYELTISHLLLADRPGVPRPIKLPESLRAFFPPDQPITADAGAALAEWAAGGKAVAAAPDEEVTADAVPAGAAGAAEGDEWADEAAEAETLNLAAAISEDAYKTTRKAVDAHRAKHGGVNAVWLAKLTDALAARMAAAEPAAEPAGDDPAGEEPLFRIPNKARA